MRFKPKAKNIMGTPLTQNELVLRIQPHEAIYMKTMVKEPGLGYHPKVTALSMDYSGSFVNQEAIRDEPRPNLHPDPDSRSLRRETLTNGCSSWQHKARAQLLVLTLPQPLLFAVLAS